MFHVPLYNYKMQIRSRNAGHVIMRDLKCGGSRASVVVSQIRQISGSCAHNYSVTILFVAQILKG